MGFGQILREAREAKGYSVTQLADMTHITSYTIEGLENEDFHTIAAPIYGRGFVKLLCQVLGIDPKPMIDEFMAIYNGEKPANRPTPPAPPPVVKPPVAEPPAPEPPPVVEPPAVEPPVYEPPTPEPVVEPTPFVEPPAYEPPAPEPAPVVEPPAPEPQPIVTPSAPEPVVTPAEEPVIEKPAAEPPAIQEPIAEVPPAFRGPVIQEPVASEPPPSDPFRLRGASPSARPAASSGFGELFDQPQNEPAAPKAAASSRFAPPQPRIDEQRKSSHFMMPEIPWRLIALIAGTLVILWILFIGCRAVYRALSAPSEDEQTTEVVEPVKPAKTVEPEKTVKPVESAQPVKSVEPVKATKPVKSVEAKPSAAKPPRTPKPVKPLYID